MAKTFCFSVRIESIECARRNRRTCVSGHFLLTGFLFRTLSACTALSKRRRVDRCEITRLPEIYFWSKDVQYLCENDLSGKIRLFIDHNKTLTAAKKAASSGFRICGGGKPKGNQKETNVEISSE